MFSRRLAIVRETVKRCVSKQSINQSIDRSIQARTLSMLVSSVKQCIYQSNNHRCRLLSVHQSIKQSVQHQRFLSVEAGDSDLIYYEIEVGGENIRGAVEKSECSNERQFRKLVLANHSELSYLKPYDIIVNKPGCTNLVHENQLRNEDLNNTNKDSRIIVKIDYEDPRPIPVSADKWTGNTLKPFDISICDVSIEHFQGMMDAHTGELVAEANLSQCARTLLESFRFLDWFIYHATLDEVVSKVKEANISLNNNAWALIKYFWLAVGPRSGSLESVVTDFVVHLLDEMQFNHGPLVICARNNLALTMNGKEVTAIAGVTVFHVARGFSVVVVEGKEDYEDYEDDEDEVLRLDNPEEPQLIAQAIAAVQFNLQYVPNNKHSEVKSDANLDLPPSAASSARNDSNTIFLIRVVGCRFSLYSATLSKSFVTGIADYWSLKPSSGLVVNRLNYNRSDQFSFARASDRHVIVAFLDRMRTSIIA